MCCFFVCGCNPTECLTGHSVGAEKTPVLISFTFKFMNIESEINCVNEFETIKMKRIVSAGLSGFINLIFGVNKIFHSKLCQMKDNKLYRLKLAHNQQSNAIHS